MADRKEAIYREIAVRELELIAGTRAVLAQARERGLKLAICTAAPPANIALACERFGLGELVDTITSPADGLRGKPYPDGYLRACELLGVDATRSVAVEDSTNGVRSAHAAGMAVVCVPPGFHPPAEDTLALCAAVLGTLDDLTEDLVVSLV